MSYETKHNHTSTIISENLVEKIKNASSDLILKVVFFGIIISGILIRSGLTTNVLLSLIISGIICYFFLTSGRINEEEQVNNCSENLDNLNDKLNKNYELIFGNLYESVLYMNPALVKIFIKMCPFYRFNTRNFKEALVSTNQLIRVYESAKLGHQLPNQTIDIADGLYRNIMNQMQSIIHSFPSTVIADYRFQVYLNILQKILQKIIDDIKIIYEMEYAKNGPNIYNPPPSVRSGPWNNPLISKEYNKHWNFYY